MDIWRAAVDATHDFLSAEDRAGIEAELAGFLPGAPLWIAADGQDRAIGFMLIEKGRIEALFVDPVDTGRGVGRALIDEAARACGTIETDVNEQNEAALRFYAKLGFVRIGRSETDGQGRAYPLLHLRREA